MAIDPYEPELAKRQKAFQIASKQLIDLLNSNISLAHSAKVEFIDKFASTREALRDYAQAGQELSEWLAQKKKD